MAAGEWALLGLIAAGAVVRFGTLGSQSFWLDESYTYGIVSHGFGHVWSGVWSTESTPPLYYVLAWFWAQVFGTSEVGLRSFSAVCATATIPVMWMVGRRLASERAGLIAAALAAFSPLLLWYSQEARSYSLFVLLSALSLWALARALEEPTPAALRLWGVICALALATHYFAAFLLLGETACLLFVLRRRSQLNRAGLIAAFTPIVVAAAVLAPFFVDQWNHPNVAASGSLGSQLSAVAQTDFGGYGGGAGRFDVPWYVALIAVGVALALGLSRRERAAAALAGGVGATAIAAVVLVALTGKNYLITRNLLETWPAIFVFLAICLGTARMRWIGLIPFAALIGLSISHWVILQGQPYLQRADWRGIVHAIGPPTTPRVLVSYQNANLSLVPYAAPLEQVPPGGTRIREIDVLSPLGAWLGWKLYPLHPAPAPPGFARTAVIRTDTYVVVRYRARVPQLERPTALTALYPGLPLALAQLQRP